MKTPTPNLAAYEIKNGVKSLTQKMDNDEAETIEPPDHQKTGRDNAADRSTPQSSVRDLLVRDSIGNTNNGAQLNRRETLSDQFVIPPSQQSREMPGQTISEGQEQPNDEASRKSTQKYANILSNVL